MLGVLTGSECFIFPPSRPRKINNHFRHNPWIYKNIRSDFGNYQRPQRGRQGFWEGGIAHKRPSAFSPLFQHEKQKDGLLCAHNSHSSTAFVADLQNTCASCFRACFVLIFPSGGLDKNDLSLPTLCTTRANLDTRLRHV